MRQHPEEGSLQAYLDGEVQSEPRELMDRHIESCAECTEHLRELDRFARRTATALQGLDVSAPDVGRARWEVRTARRVRRRRWAPARIAAAASIVLLAGATVAVAMPGSPIRSWLTGGPPGGPEAAVLAEVRESQEPQASAVERFMASAVPSEGRIGVSFTDVPGSTILEIELLDGESAVTLVRARADADFETANGWIMVDVGGAPGDLQVQLPVSAAVADVSVNGSTVFRMDAGRTSYPGPAPLGDEDGTLRFRVGGPVTGGTGEDPRG